MQRISPHHVLRALHQTQKKTIVIAHAKLDLRDLKATTFVSLPHTSADIVTVLHLELDAGNYEKCHFRSA